MYDPNIKNIIVGDEVGIKDLEKRRQFIHGIYKDIKRDDPFAKVYVRDDLSGIVWKDAGKWIKNKRLINNRK